MYIPNKTFRVLCSASVASVMKELTLLQLSPFGHVRALYTCPCTHVGTLVRCALRLSDNAVVARVPVPRGVLMLLLMLVKKDRNKCSCSNRCACGRQGGAPSSSQLPCTFNPLHWQLLDQDSLRRCMSRHRFTGISCYRRVSDIRLNSWSNSICSLKRKLDSPLAAVRVHQFTDGRSRRARLQ